MPARDIALCLLVEVLDKHHSLTDALERTSAGNPSDKAFGRLIASTVLRRLGDIDARLARHIEKPLPRKADAIRHILRIGAAQLIHLDTATHAAVNCAVEQAKAQPGRYDRLVNAVLRQIIRTPAASITEEPTPSINTPDWLWQSWRAAYGEETAAAIATAHLGEAPLDLALKTPGQTADWTAALDGTSLAPGHVRLARAGDVTALPGFAEGAWWVQDLAAGLPVRVLSHALAGLENKSVADLCAAPGGKTAQLAAGGARVWAVDADVDRLARVTDNLSRLGLTAQTITADARNWSPSETGTFDAVLLDAPCTATGTIRRHPDIPWLKRPDDVEQAAALQRDLLTAALRLVKPGGVLVYAVCSLQPEEGADIVNRIVASGGAERWPIARGETDGIAAPDANGDVRTLPCDRTAEGGMDGFFVARLRRAD